MRGEEREDSEREERRRKRERRREVAQDGGEGFFLYLYSRLLI